MLIMMSLFFDLSLSTYRHRGCTGQLFCLECGRVKAKTVKLVFAASPLSMQHYGNLWSKIIDWLAQNQDNVSKRSNMSIR